MAATKRLNKAQKAENESASEGQEKLGGKEYERELARLRGELVKLQLWVVAKGANHPGAVGAFDRSHFRLGACSAFLAYPLDFRSAPLLPPPSVFRRSASVRRAHSRRDLA
jgi:hypothetical protein